MKQTSRNPWDILGLNPNATETEIKDAFRRLALKFHPDRKHGDTKKFQSINNAYNKLKNKQMIPIIEAPSTKMVNLKLSIEQQINGVDDYVELEPDEFIKVTIPPGAIAGDRFKINDQGKTFIINITELANSTFTRQGASILMDLEIDIVTAMTGGKIEIEDPSYNTFALDIPAGISHNSIITVKEAGLLNRKIQERGNLYVTVKIKIPKLDTTSKLNKLISRLKNE
jgi:DnaJ-class molecular chaperone